MNRDEITLEMFKTIKPEDVKKASDEGELLAFFGGIVKKIFPSTTIEWKEKIDKKHSHGITPSGMDRSDCPACNPKPKRIKESELLTREDSVRIGSEL